MADLHQDDIQREVRREMDNLLKRELSDIKDEIKAVRGLLERMVRVEEKLSNAATENERLRTELADIYRRLSVIETSGATSKQSLGNLERFGWISLAALLAWLGNLIKGHP